jgi:hypothetical protein
MCEFESLLVSLEAPVFIQRRSNVQGYERRPSQLSTTDPHLDANALASWTASCMRCSPAANPSSSGWRDVATGALALAVNLVVSLHMRSEQ